MHIGDNIQENNSFLGASKQVTFHEASQMYNKLVHASTMRNENKYFKEIL